MDDETPTRTYRLFRIGGDGRISDHADAIEAATDADALRRALSLARGRQVEVWDGVRRVGTVAGADPEAVRRTSRRTSGQHGARRAMVDACRRMNAVGLNQGTSGNLSVRAGTGFLVTPTSLPYDAMEPGDIVSMDFDGTYEGARRPSSEWRFHADILRLRPDVGCVLHCHATYATTLACHRRDIPSFHYMVAVAGGTTIRCAPYATFGTQELSDHALRALEGRRACLLGQHGMIALGAAPAAALALAVEVEALARLYLQALALGEPPVLPDDEMERVLARMRRMSYGEAPQSHEGNAGAADGVARPRRSAA